MQIIIGLDISKKRIGIAICYIKSSGEIIINPLNIFENYKSHEVNNIVTNIKKQYTPDYFVIGLPSKNYENYKFIKDFTHKYRNILTPFFFQNEDYSSFLSNLSEDSNSCNDNIAASIILNNFIRKK